MFQFVLVNLIFISLGLLLYLMARALPRVKEDTEEGAAPGFLDRWATSDLPERIDTILNSSLAKFLRKVKVGLLKLDNTLTAWLQKVRGNVEKNSTPTNHLQELRDDDTKESPKELT